MGGEWAVTKPSRSDDVLDAEEQMKMAQQIRCHFDSIAPRRPMKPNRSEGPFMDGQDPISSSSVESIPELDKLQALRSQSHLISFAENPTFVQEEFVETQYYNKLNSIDKQHHTTGNGFIRVAEGKGGDDFVIQLREEEAMRVGEMVGFRSNPATNEWIPKMEEEAVFVSSKPNRSESD